MWTLHLLTLLLAMVVTQSSLPPMPEYTYSFNLSGANIIVFRIYENYGDGSSTGWQASTIKPKLTLTYNSTTIRIKVFCIYRYNHSPYIRYYKGSRNFGYDQFAQYYTAVVDPSEYPADAVLHASGSFYQSAYSSITSYNYSNTPDLILGQPLFHASATGWQVSGSDTSNPFIVGNPSVLAYEPASRGDRIDEIPTPEEEMRLRDLESVLSFSYAPDMRKLPRSVPALAAAIKEGEVISDTGKVDFYRLDEYLSSLCLPDASDFGAGGCSDEYIFAPTTPETSQDQVYILRVRVPSTFFNSSHPSAVFDSYQSTYFSVSSNRNNSLIEANHDTGKLDIDAFLPKYWTVDSRMMNALKDEEGYAYIFCVPDEYARALSAQQNDGYSWENRTQPPVLVWGDYKGYALAEASYAIILRYKEPQSSWEGSPSHARCYPTIEENKPLPAGALGSYTPEAYQGSFKSFLEGRIGAVRKQGPWPSKV